MANNPSNLVIVCAECGMTNPATYDICGLCDKPLMKPSGTIVPAQAAFVARFKRQAASRIDSEWLNGYASALDDAALKRLENQPSAHETTPNAGPYCPETRQACERMCQSICNRRASAPPALKHCWHGQGNPANCPECTPSLKATAECICPKRDTDDSIIYTHLACPVHDVLQENGTSNAEEQ